ncbi:DUF4232 domain-containing protein [Streptomyces sp. SPB162]|uniref:DUF4232 domain-containing protein n=1 Tax=Streptomyces sp. SPB162 TaxID=2940560 RepID=UPI002406004B|nr:DUF4232 domain-containing protein [Streptomyces sp. SPB162]MDF9816944.1 hypothetical protein [Streptomyces sp. SPB162]
MTALLNRLPRHGAAVLAMATLTTGAVACSSSVEGARSSGVPNHAPTTPAPAKGTGTPTATPSAASSGNHTAGGSPTTAGVRPDAAASPDDTSTANTSTVVDLASITRCHTADLKAGFDAAGGAAPDMTSTHQTRASVYFTNISRHTCSLIGFPGVDIVGDRATDGTWSLTRSSASPTKILLKPSNTTSFSITLLPTTAPAAESFQPAIVRITPPDEKTQFSLKWPWGGSITRQDAATHPGTFVNPMGS